MTATHKIILGFLLCTLLGLVGTMDVQDARVQQQHYCDMVTSGAWPDFNDNHDAVCGAGRG